MSTASPEATRQRVLTALRRALQPLTVAELADDLGLHPNTVRFHTGALMEDGLIRQESLPAAGRGRPRATYRPTDEGSRSGRRDYQVLAEVLINEMVATSPRPERAASEAGRAWGRRLATRLRPAPRTRTARADLAREVLDELGFEPRSSADGTNPGTIDLHNCPFRDLVDERSTLVCALHAGMLEGLLQPRSGAAPTRATLVPFATPSACRVTVT